VNLVGRPVTSVVAPEYVALMQEQLERKLRGARSTDYEVEVMTADGRRRRAEISSVPIAGGDSCHAVFGVALVRPAPRSHLAAVNLTPRQNQILRMLAEGASTDQIATMLHLSRETVRNHIRNILRTLGAHSRLEARGHRKAARPSRRLTRKVTTPQTRALGVVALVRAASSWNRVTVGRTGRDGETLHAATSSCHDPHGSISR